MKTVVLILVSLCTVTVSLVAEDTVDSTRYAMKSEWSGLKDDLRKQADQAHRELEGLNRARHKVRNDINALQEDPAVHAGFYMNTIKEEIDNDQAIVSQFSPSRITEDTNLRASADQLVQSLVSPIVTANSSFGGRPGAGAVAVALSNLSIAQSRKDERGAMAAFIKLLTIPIDDPEIRGALRLPSSMLETARSAKATAEALQDPARTWNALSLEMQTFRNAAGLVNALAPVIPFLRTDPRYQALFLVLEVISRPGYLEKTRDSFREFEESASVAENKLDLYTEAQFSLPVLQAEYAKLQQLGPGQFRAQALGRLYVTHIRELVQIDSAIDEQQAQLARTEHQLKELQAEDEAFADIANSVLRRWYAESREALDERITMDQRLLREERLAHERNVKAVKDFWTGIFTAPFKLLQSLAEASASLSSNSSNSNSSGDREQRSYTDDHESRSTFTSPSTGQAYHQAEGWLH